jgi:hypothetical protein
VVYNQRKDIRKAVDTKELLCEHKNKALKAFEEIKELREQEAAHLQEAFTNYFEAKEVVDIVNDGEMTVNCETTKTTKGDKLTVSWFDRMLDDTPLPPTVSDPLSLEAEQGISIRSKS